MDSGVLLAAAWAVYAGSVVVRVGYGTLPVRARDDKHTILTAHRAGWYLSIILGCIPIFWRQNARTPARRILLPYAVLTFVLNSTFVLQVVVEQGFVSIEPKSHTVQLQKQHCSSGNILSAVLLPLVVSMNDTLLVCLPSYRGSQVIWTTTSSIVPAHYSTTDWLI
jgi:hypothetical protein